MKKYLAFITVMTLLLSFVVTVPAEAETKATKIEVIPFAGNGYFDWVDGDALNASFRAPSGIMVLSDGSMLVADTRNQVIRKIQNSNVSTLAGLTLEMDEYNLPQGGYYDDSIDSAFFNGPVGISVDSKGNILIADALNNVIRKISDGQVSTIAGNGFIGSEDGIGEKARFHSPQSVVATDEGTLYVADTLNHVIRKISVDGEVTTLNAPSDRVVQFIPGEVVWAGDYEDGPLENAKFNEPAGLAIDSKGNLYVSDSGNQLIRYIDFSTNTVSTVAGNFNAPNSTSLYASGSHEDGSADESSFNFPRGLAYSEEYGLLIADSVNQSIRVFKDGEIRTIVTGATGIKNPTDITVGQDRNIYFADSYDNRIYQILIERGLRQ